MKTRRPAPTSESVQAEIRAAVEWVETDGTKTWRRPELCGALVHLTTDARRTALPDQVAEQIAEARRALEYRHDPAECVTLLRSALDLCAG